MKTNHFILRGLGKLLAVWMTVVLGMTNAWAVMQSPTSAQLSVTPNPAMAGQTVTLRMTVTGTNPAAAPTGAVTFKEGLTVLGSVNLNNGVAAFDTRFNTAGIHGVTATYAGDSNNGGTSMTTWFTVTAATTTTQLVPSVNPARPGQAVTLTAMVAGVNPTGTVTFKNGNTLLGTALLTAGTATITHIFNTVGNYPLTASYGGDTNNQTSTSAIVMLAVSIEPQVYYIHTDHLDTPRTITDTNGTVVWQWDNTDPFGANMPNENPGGVGQFTFNLRFAGQYFDRETGLNYNVNRDYSPALGRYIESDPIGLAGGINTYHYVEGNPLTFIDPYGLWVGIDDAIAAGGGALVGLVGQGIGDLISGNLSGWERYSAAALGGAAGGETLLYTANPFLAGAIGGATTNAIGQGLELASGKRNCFSWTSAATDTALGTATGLIPGPGKLLPRITAGRGSYSSIAKQMFTRLQSGQIQNISLSTTAKMVASNTAEGLPGSGAAAVAGTPISKAFDNCGCNQ